MSISFKAQALSFLMFFVVFTTLGQAESPEDKGKKIGTIVKSAITEAVPGLETLYNIFWPEGKNKVRKEEFEEKLKTAKDEIKTELVANFQSKLTPINTKFKEISLINDFMLPSSIAEADLIKLKVKLNTKDLNWKLIEEDWKVLKNQLNKITKIKEDELKVISEFWVKEVLTKIINLDDNEITRIDSRINSKNKDGVTQLLDILSDKLEPLDRISAYYLEDFKDDLKSLGDMAKGGMGEKEDDNENKEVIKNSFKSN